MKNFMIVAYQSDDHKQIAEYRNDEETAKQRYEELKRDKNTLALYLCEIVDRYGHTWGIK